ncbi:uncharacterized protein LOC118438820 isoform X2 [Folsomia candida]|uniref:uncharacterized protein LOC118438820 isoform X2 n=1 Tax=Folsomia candida TaxID=158441 RepID=UPI0016054F37|nr:uncharacterized protein LOC118438820 isoform X2 [Folsomia candida]
MSRKKECQDFSRNADDPTASPNSGPGLIPDIIPHLCKFLVIKDIKDCRLVCKSWNYEATPVLKERTLINIRLDAGTYGKTPPKEWELDERIAEKLSFNTNIKISANKSLSPPKNLQDFPPIRNLKSILVQIKITEQWQKDFCNEIILGSAPTLEELQLHCDQNFPSFSATVFPRLKKLVINGGRTRAQLDPVIERIGQAVTEAFPALQCFTINCEHLYEISKLELLQHFPLYLFSRRRAGTYATAARLGGGGVSNRIGVGGAPAKNRRRGALNYHGWVLI